MYFQSVSEDRVRAPQTRSPRPGKNRSALMPTGLSTSCSRLVMSAASPPTRLIPRITTFAGALCTPRFMSVSA